jgi:hypothetical protein
VGIVSVANLGAHDLIVCKGFFMMRIVICLLFVLVTAGKVWTQDPVKTDGDKYKVVFENERVRILAYRDDPGDKTLMHAHPDFVVVARAVLSNEG